jgi:Nuclease-related domain
MVYTVVLLVVVGLTTAKWTLLIGFVLGMVGIGFWVLPEVIVPDHISRWERGAWGEQNTAKALRSLRKEGWLIRHDLATGYGNANRDHIAVGPAVYLLDSKLLKDEVRVEKGRLHVHRLDASDDRYEVEAPTRSMAAAAKALKRDLDEAVGFPVGVYPVVVIWGHFDAGEQWDGSVAYVDGDKIADWLRQRPRDLRDERKQRAVQDWLRALPRA